MGNLEQQEQAQTAAQVLESLFRNIERWRYGFILVVVLTWLELYVASLPITSKICPERPPGAVIDGVEGQVSGQASVQALG